MAKQVKIEAEMTDTEVLGSSSLGCGPKWPAHFTIAQMRAQLRHEQTIPKRP